MKGYFKFKTIFISLLMILCINFVAFADTYCGDYENSWAKDEINYLKEKKIINGYSDGSFKPKSNITRAQFVKIINNVFGFTNKCEINYKDLNKSNWFYKDFEIAVNYGYISGYGENLIKPSNFITRQEAAKIISIAFDLVNTERINNNYVDENDIDTWAKQYVNIVSSNKIMKGYSDKTFKPTNFITREEVAKIISNACRVFYNTEGTYSEDTIGNIIVNTKDVTLKDMLIEGNLYLAEGIDIGDVYLDNVEITGNIIVRGGGENSIHIRNSKLKSLNSIRKFGKVRIVFEGNTIVNDITACENTIICFSDNSVANQLILNGKSKVSIEKNAEIKNIIVNNKNVNIVASGTIGNLIANEKLIINNQDIAKGKQVKVSGNTISDKNEKPIINDKPSIPDKPSDNFEFKSITDKETYNINDIISVSGKVTNNNIGLKDIDITIKLYGDYYVTLDQITTDANGEYTYNFKVPFETEGGQYKLVLKANEPINKTIEFVINIDGNLVADKTDLEAKINEISILVEEEYTSETWSYLETKLKKANKIMAMDDATQLLVDETLMELSDAVDQLVKKSSLYIQKLIEKIDEASFLIKEEYTSESWENLQNSLALANKLINEKEENYSKLEKALLNLEAAIKQLKKVELADKKLLKDAIEQAKSLNKNDYTDLSWNELMVALELAEQICNNKEASQNNVDTALTNLNDAIDNLVPKSSQSEVNVTFYTFNIKSGEIFGASTECTIEVKNYTEDLLIITTGLTDDEIKSVVIESSDKNILDVTQRRDYPEGGFPKSKTRAFGEGLVPGKARIIATVTSIDGVVYKTEYLVNIIKPINKSKLNTKIIEAQKLTEADYTKESWSLFKDALDNAIKVYENNIATQKEIDEALGNLNDAIINLEKIQAPVQINVILDYMDGSWGSSPEQNPVCITIQNSDDTKNYVQVKLKDKLSDIQLFESYSMLNMDISMKEFEELLKSENEKIIVSVFEDIEGKELISSKEVELKLHVNKEELEKIIDEAQKLTEADYTKESWSLFKDALDNAIKVYENDSATQKEVNTALDNLNSTIDNLIPKSNQSEVNVTFYTFNIKSGEIFGASTECTIEVKNYTEDLLIVTTGLSDEEIESVVIESSDKTILSVTQRPESSEGGFPKSKTRAYGEGLVPGKAKIIATITSIYGDVYKAEYLVNIIKPTDKSKLNTKIIEAQKLTEADYTKESWSLFKDALDKAIKVSENDSATQDDVDMALDNLKNTINDLQKAENEQEVCIILEYFDGSWDGSGNPVMFCINLNGYNTEAKKYKVFLGEYESSIDSIDGGYGLNMEININDFQKLLETEKTVNLVLLADDDKTVIETIKIAPTFSDGE